MESSAKICNKGWKYKALEWLKNLQLNNKNDMAHDCSDTYLRPPKFFPKYLYKIHTTAGTWCNLWSLAQFRLFHLVLFFCLYVQHCLIWPNHSNVYITALIAHNKPSHKTPIEFTRDWNYCMQYFVSRFCCSCQLKLKIRFLLILGVEFVKLNWIELRHFFDLKNKIKIWILNVSY